MEVSPEDRLRSNGVDIVALPTLKRPQHASLIWDAGDDLDPIEPRGWLLGNTFCRRFLSSIVAGGGTGKSSLRILQGLALASGRPLTGEHIHHRCRVLLISLEDDQDELRRRVKAAMIYYEISSEEISGRLFLATPGALKLVERSPDGSLIDGPLIEFIRTAVRTRGIDLVSIDPFVKCHGAEENDNGAIDRVVSILAALAIELNIALDAPHHTSKGVADPGNADRGRGASAFKDAARLVYTLTEMSPEDAENLGVPNNERRSLVRMDPGKVNIAPKADSATWFKLIPVHLGNATADYPSGDSVQVITPWQPTDLWSQVSSIVANQILDDIEAGMSDGSRYSGAKSARKRAAWPLAIKHVPGFSEPQGRTVVKTWLGTGLLEERDYHNDKSRKEESGLFVVPGKRPT